MDKAKASDALMNEDIYKRGGQILFRMSNFKAFSVGTWPKIVISDTTEHINGMPWRIQIEYHNDHLGLFLCCDGDPNDMAWSCQADYQLSIVSFTTDEDCFMTKAKHLFNAVEANWGWFKFAKFEEFMDPKNGIYDEKSDAMTFKAQLTAEKPRGMAGIRTADPLLVNGNLVYVNKFILSAHSEFFHKLFFGPMAEKMPNVKIDDAENAVESFGRLIATMYPQNLELDDDCVESVLHLANRFLIDSVENLCVNFLMNKSKKSVICKFRLAHQCSISGMKVKIRDSMTKKDFLVAEENHYDILSEHDKLGAEGAEELRSKYDELFGKK